MKITKLLIAFFLLITVSFTTSAVSNDYKKMLGKWEYSVPTASYPYSNGTLELKDVNGKLKGEFNIQGEKIETQTVTYSDNELTIKMDVQNTPVVAKLKLVDGQLVGKVDSVEGSSAITAKPKK